jgi:aryl-alcohol dehydrogenase-like predicted oxidoreductase
VSLVEASYLWLLHHSAMGPSDGLLLGASSEAQLDSNLNALRKVIAVCPGDKATKRKHRQLLVQSESRSQPRRSATPF